MRSSHSDLVTHSLTAALSHWKKFAIEKKNYHLYMEFMYFFYLKEYWSSNAFSIKQSSKLPISTIFVRVELTWPSPTLPYCKGHHLAEWAWDLNHRCVTRKYRVWAMLTTRVEEWVWLTVLVRLPLSICELIQDLLSLSLLLPDQGARAQHLELTWNKSLFLKSKILCNCWFKV